MNELINPWLPIEEAPLDGTMVILWDEKSYNKLVIGCKWKNGQWVSCQFNMWGTPVHFESLPSHFMYYPVPPKRRI